MFKRHLYRGTDFDFRQQPVRRNPECLDRREFGRMDLCGAPLRLDFFCGSRSLLAEPVPASGRCLYATTIYLEGTEEL